MRKMEEKVRKLEEENEKLQRALEEKINTINKTTCLALMLGVLGVLGVIVPVSQVPEVPEYQYDLQLMLVGKTGAGKSASGNTILGEEEFRVDPSPESLTNSCSSLTKVMDGKRVTVIDTPGVSDTWLTSVPTDNNPYDCISDISHRPHTFLLVIKLGRYTEEERNTVKWVQEKFGERANMFTIVLFTGGDLIGQKPIDKFIRQSSELTKLIEMCEGGYHVFNNNDKGNRNQVTELFKKINKMLQKSLGYKYMTEVSQKVEQDTREMMERKIGEIEKEMNEMKKKSCKIEEEANQRITELKKDLKEMAIALRDEQYENTQLGERLQACRWFW